MSNWKVGLRRVLYGRPLDTAADINQRLSNIKALAIFSSDALSSVAYGTEEILWVLVAASAISFSIPIHLGLALLLFILTTSYRQTIAAYPGGGGSYIVAKNNLGIMPGLVAGTSLLADYILTVAVSVSAGIAAITSLNPALLPFRVELAVVAVLIITLVNLRGVQETGNVFAVPTYAFIITTLLTIVVGLFRQVPVAVPTVVDTSAVAAATGLPLFVILRAFAAGCTSLTGVEAISNGVPAFRPPEARHARQTMAAMATLLAVMLLGMGFLTNRMHVVPNHEVTIMSQVAANVWGAGSFMHGMHQLFTMLILILAANTSFADFPRLGSLLSRDHFLPRSLSTRGDRLVYNNGIVLLGVLSSLLIILFRGTTHALIPLYAVGVFTSFTLSQTGMVVHWLQLRHKQRIWFPAFINGIGAITTLVVTAVIVTTKFIHGAWIVILVIPTFMSVFLAIYRHYASIQKDLKVGLHTRITPHTHNHLVVLLIGGTTSVTRAAVEYMLTLVSSTTVLRAVHVNLHKVGNEKTQERKEEFTQWVGDSIPLEVLESPYRSIIDPLDEYISRMQKQYPDHIITLVVPEFVPRNPVAARLLHGQTGRMLYDHFRRRDINVMVIPHKVS